MLDKIFRSIFGGGAKEKPKFYPTQVVGESFHRAELLKVTGCPPKDGYRREFNARLVPERNNKHDKNAVRIEINGLPVGHLGRADAKTYRARNGGEKAKSIQCKARIMSSGTDYGVYLDISIEKQE